jgi:hypothetical protein
MRGNEDAFGWLMKNGYPHFGALDRAIDGDKNAYLWLVKNDFQLLAFLADACHAEPSAIDYFNRNNLPIFLLIARKFIAFRDSQFFDYHKRQS